MSQLAAPGACLVHDALGMPLIIARGRDGRLIAMLNVCRHRGTRLVEEPGFCRVNKGFRCVYHGWTYDLRGELTHVPRQELFPSLEKRSLALTKVAVTERFEGEDLSVCEQIQRGLRSGANDRFRYGGEEAPIQWWHAELDRRIQQMPPNAQSISRP